jgi:adenosylhomocysteine nucleosidase
MIGITFALPAESSGLRRQLNNRRRQDDLLIGTIDDRPVAIIHTGVGAQNCNQRMEQLLHKARPKFVISTGFAGAVTNDLKVNDLILSENFSDAALLKRAEEILDDRKPRKVKLFTSTSVVDSMAERNEIARASGAAAVDMESGSIAEICRAHGVRMISLRAISDMPTDPLPAPANVLFDVERQKTSYGRLSGYLLSHPRSIFGLLQFSRRIKRVRATLTEALVALANQL